MSRIVGISALMTLILGLSVIGWREPAKYSQPTQPASFSKRFASSTDGIKLLQNVPRELQARLDSSFGMLPLVFEANRGQAGPKVKYLARGATYMLYLNASDVILSLQGAHDTLTTQPGRSGINRLKKVQNQPQDRFDLSAPSFAMLQMQMVGANQNPQIVASKAQTRVSNYLLGKNPRHWFTNVPSYGNIAYQNLYAGVNLLFHGEQHQLEFDFIVTPGADPAQIKLSFHGANQVSTDRAGDLVLSTSVGEINLHKPVAYQEKGGVRNTVEASFAVNGENQVSFVLGSYDRSRELVIDPTLIYSTYLGGPGEDAGFGIAMDNSGNAYVTGKTNSTMFPGGSGSPTGGFDAFVTKLNADGSAILYTTFLGGSSDDGGTSIAVDSSSNVYVAGATSSSDFPVTSGAAQTKLRGTQNAFVAKLDASGSAITYATYLGGNGSDSANAIAIDATGHAYVAGGSQSSDFPTTAGALQTKAIDGLDAFVAKLDPTGKTLLYSTYLGGSAFDTAHGIALLPGCMSNCDAYVVGDTGSKDFPLKNAFDSVFMSDDAFVTVLNSTGSGLIYSTFLGGSDIEQGFGIAVDSSGAAYLTGYTLSDDFPVAGAFQSELHGFADGFVSKLSSDGSKLIYSSYLGSGDEGGLSIAVDSHGNAYVVGLSRTSLFPLVDPIQTTLQGDSDAFVTMIDPTGATMVYSTYLGGNGDDNYQHPGGNLFGSIALDSSGAVYITGRTTSTNGFPMKMPLQGSFGGGAADAYLTKLSPAPTTPELSIGVFPNAWLVSSGGSASPITVTVTPLNDFTGTVDLACSGLPAHASCNFNPPSVTTSGTSILTISTRENSAQLIRPINLRATSHYAILLTFSAVAVLSLAILELNSRKRGMVNLTVCALVFFGLLFLGACGATNSPGGANNGDNGGGGGGGGSNGGAAATPAGTYPITVTGSSGASSHAAILVLEVN